MTLHRQAPAATHEEDAMSDYPDYFDDGTPDMDDDRACVTCDGRGEVIVCWDDVCQGTGTCMHGGSGYALCGDCAGTGEHAHA